MTCSTTQYHLLVRLEWKGKVQLLAHKDSDVLISVRGTGDSPGLAYIPAKLRASDASMLRAVAQIDNIDTNGQGA